MRPLDKKPGYSRQHLCNLGKVGLDNLPDSEVEPQMIAGPKI